MDAFCYGNGLLRMVSGFYWKYWLTLVSLVLVFALPCSAEDKNGVSPNTISLPSGPGSIEGLGEAFQPMLNTGTAKYGIKIALPPGTAGHAPVLSLNYESGNGYGAAGLGWTYGPGSVHRQTDKGIPRYVDGPNGLDDDHDGEIDEPDELDRFIGLEDEELVLLADGTYRARIEGTFIRYRRTGEHWEAHLKDGSRLEYGLTPQGRITDETGNKVFKWLLEKDTDTSGNVIAYFYKAFPGSDNQKYLSEIRYGPGASPWPAFYFVYFTYEDRVDWRKDYRSGFLVKTGKRLSQIDIGIQGVLPDQCAEGDWNQDGTTDALIRRYALSYDPDLPLSFLTKVTQYSANGISYLPPISFTYSAFQPEPVVSASGTLISSDTAPASVMDSGLVDLIDLNRDGLPDLLQTDFNGSVHRYFQNLGVNIQGDQQELSWDDAQNIVSPYGQAQLLHLVEDEVHLADMDGNGISDLIHTPTSKDVYYFLNQGDGSWGEKKRMSIQDTAPPAPFTSDDVETSDLDFDKRMDVVQSTDAGYAIWFNVEEGKYSRKVQTGGATYRGDVIRFSQTGVHLVDLNGDRMNDVARIRPTHVIYCANMGHGRFDTAVEIPIPDTVLTDDENGLLNRAEIKDVNGDGLSDLVIERARPNELWYWPNLGTDAFSDKHIVTDMPSAFGEHMVTRWADINGNGTTDLIYADSSATSRLVALDIGELSGGSAHSNLLIGIDNGLGVRTEITYKSSTAYYVQSREEGRPWAVTIPFPVSVIAQVRTTTGLDVDMVPGGDEYIKTYRYRDGFYEDREKAFRGFAQVTVTEMGDVTAPTRVTTHDFFTGGPDGIDNDGDTVIDEVSDTWHREEDALKGLVKSIAVRAEDGFLFSEDTNDWLVRNLAMSTDNIEVRFAYNREKQKLIYEGNATPEAMSITFVYDDFGNVTEERNFGALSIVGDEAFTFTEYINDTNLWIIGLPQRQYITSEGLEVFSETRNYYDGADYTGLLTGQVTKGNLTRQEGWVEGATYVNLVRNAYDIYGNVTGIRDPNGNQRIVIYDSLLHTYPVQEDIEIGGGNPDLTVTAAYNLGLGVITSNIGFNGHQTTYGHDTFGRLTSIVRPGDSPIFPSRIFSYTLGDPEKGLLYAYDTTGLLTLTSSPSVPSSIQTRSREVSGQPGTFDSVQYVDGLGRKLAVVEEGEAGFIVKEAALFNAMGTVQSLFLPYSAPSQQYATPLPDNPALEVHYDAAGRKILGINPPDADNVITTVSTAYHPLSKTITDENSHEKTFIYDGLERLIEVNELNLSENYVARYDYDPLNNLTRITDAQNNVKTIVYDGLSRKTQMNDPDRGTMDYTYDDAGNVIQTIDNKGQVVGYTYDGAHRLLTEDYQDGGPHMPDISYHYDVVSSDYPSAENTRGNLSWVEDLSGGTFFSYDPRGNTTWSVKRLSDSGVYRDFLFINEYDAMDRVVSSIYPDGDQVEYTYNNRSFLENISGFLDNLNYLPSGRLNDATYANGLQTTYTYDPRNRMTGLVTDTTIPTGSPIQDLAYTFDGVGNITSMADNRLLPPSSPENATQAFQYDHIYRLTRAEGPGYGAIDFDYDKIGNMVFKSSPDAPDPQHIDDPLINLGTMASGGAMGPSNRGVRLPGASPGPHAITSTQSGLVFQYDDNGNMTDKNGDLYKWDFRDRLIRTTTPETVANYIYDYSGQRVVKKSQADGKQEIVYYPSNGFEIRDGKAIKYIFSDSKRIAKVEGRLTTGGEVGWQVLNFRSGWNFFSLEVEPDDPAIASVLASLTGKYTEVWAFDALAQQYQGYIVGQGTNDLTELHAQQGYIVYVTEPIMFMVSGTRATNSIILEDGWNLIPCPSDIPMALMEALTSIGGKYKSVWTFDTADASWRNFVHRKPPFVNNLETMEPGRAYWIHMTEAALLEYRETPPKVYYYHPEHLGSSSLVTDVNGNVVERTEFYPFGMVRHELRDNFWSTYKYAGKERDQESGLDYLGARYYMPDIGKFISADPLWEMTPTSYVEDDLLKDTLEKPQQMNMYSYALNNPVNLIDVFGLKAGDPFDSPVDAAHDFAKNYNDDSIRRDREYGAVIYTYKKDGERKYSYTLPREGTEDSIELYKRRGAVSTVHSHGAYRPWSNVPSGTDREKMVIADNYAYLVTPGGALIQYDKGKEQTPIRTKAIPSDPKDPNRKNTVSPAGAKDPVANPVQRMSRMVWGIHKKILQKQREEIMKLHKKTAAKGKKKLGK